MKIINNVQRFLVISFMFISITSCSQNRTYLDEEEKNWNPYKKGQVLIFESVEYGRDSIQILELEFRFPDGLGVVDYNESLFVLGESASQIDLGKQFSNAYSLIKISSKTEKKPSHIEYQIELKNTKFIGGQKFLFQNLMELPEIQHEVAYGTFNDVVIIGNKKNYSKFSKAIELFYWSKSKGFLAFDKYDGAKWELVDILEP